VTLGRLVLAWMLVAAWFVLATYAIPLLVGVIWKPGAQPGVGVVVEQSLLRWRLIEAGLLTVFASLWFDSLGAGGWWLLFVIVGALATLPRWRLRRSAPLPGSARAVGAGADLVRYLVAGAILAWLLR
jgi:hypothetical protein